jgi:hypothetical protein
VMMSTFVTLSAYTGFLKIILGVYCVTKLFFSTPLTCFGVTPYKTNVSILFKVQYFIENVGIY